MNSLSTSSMPRTKGRYLTAEAFVAFLTMLSPDPEIAGEKYEELRRQLIKFFEWRRTLLADQLADETLNRVVRKIQEGERIEKNIFAMSLGIARFVFKEHMRHPDNRRVEIAELSGLAAPPCSSLWLDHIKHSNWPLPASPQLRRLSPDAGAAHSHRSAQPR